MKVLHIDSSILGPTSVTGSRTRVSAPPDLQIVYRDLIAAPIPNISGVLVAARATALADRTADQQREVGAGDGALGEFLAADLDVIGAPIYNFSIPSQLKNWIDRLAVREKAYRDTSTGPIRLANGKR